MNEDTWEHPETTAETPAVDPKARWNTRTTTKKDPLVTLNRAMVVYIFVTMLFALPLVIFPATFFDAVGLDALVAEQLGALRWMGAMLLAWAISGILVLARPGGRAIFVTTGALQMTFASLALLYSWSIGEVNWSGWFHTTATAISVGAAVFLWWARFVARKLFKASGLEER